MSAVGVQEMFARDGALVDRADGQGQVPWTPPLHRLQAVALVGVVRTAAAAVIAAVSGMRASELMELQVGCRLLPEEPRPGLARYRLAGKLVKGQPLGGTRDEWVVIEPAYQAAGLAEQLHDDPADGDLLFGRIAFSIRYKWFRNWVNGPSGQRLGLAPIPDYPVNLRSLRRTLAIELAYRPGGVLAAKFQLKHIVTATTEGYASRPGGAQAELLAEVNKHESERNLALLWDEFRNYQQGIMPAGPGARELTDFFASVDAGLDPAQAPAAKVQRSDREILQPPHQARQRAAPRHRELLLVHRPVPGTLPPARRNTGPPASPSSECATRPAARRPPTTPATGPSGPSTPRTPRRSSASSAGRRRPNEHACKPSTTAPPASWPGSTRPQPAGEPG